jgi:hypothetical protein
MKIVDCLSNRINSSSYSLQICQSCFVLFDDNEFNPQIATTNDRQSFANEWARLTTNKERENLLSGFSNDDDRSIFVLILSNTDVQNIFSSTPSASNN